MDGCPFLPEVIIVDILSRLPVKSVGQCRCVCKLWRVLLSDPQFIRTHLNNTQHDEESIIFTTNYSRFITFVPLSSAHHRENNITVSSKILPFPTDRNFSCGQIYGSCDGLVLVQLNHHTKRTINQLTLLNPLTSELTEVPTPPPLALNPRFPRDFVYGLGYDSVSDDYKIVYLTCHCPCNSYHIYSLKKNTWKKVEGFDQFDSYLEDLPAYSSSALVDGNSHWLGNKHTATRDTWPVIVAFDFTQEMLFEVPLPSLPDIRGKKGGCYNVQVLGGCLSTCDRNSWMDIHTPDFETNVWVMKEYGVQTSWTKVFKIMNRNLFFPLCLLGQGQVVLVQSHWYVKNLVVYDTEEGTITDVVFPRRDIQIAHCNTFKGSLVSPHLYRN